MNNYNEEFKKALEAKDYNQCDKIIKNLSEDKKIFKSEKDKLFDKFVDSINATMKLSTEE